MAEFKRGQDNIETIFITDIEQIRVSGKDKIVVVMENGQMEEVPWFEVIKDEKVVGKYNAACCLGVSFKQDNS